jgi:hypothetical protein
MRRQSYSFSGSAGEPLRNDLHYQQSGTKMKGSAPLDIVLRSGLHHMSIGLPRLMAQGVQTGTCKTKTIKILCIRYPKQNTYLINGGKHYMDHDKWDNLTTAWRIHKLRMEKQSPTWMVAAHILHKQSQTANKGWSSS